MAAFNLALNVLSANRQANITGVPPEQLAAIIRQHEDHSETQKKLIERLERDLDLNERQMREALRILGENDVPNERLGAKLIEIASHFVNLRSGASADPGDSPALVVLKLEVQKAIDAGDLTKADALLEDIATEQRRDVARTAINLSSTLARRAEISMTVLRYREAAGHFASAAAVLPSGSECDDMRISYTGAEARALYLQGYEFGDNGALLSAIDRFRGLATLALREQVPFQWVSIQNSLGSALGVLGQREAGTERLQQAVAAFRVALEEQTRERVPLDWALKQNNLGNALGAIGVRERGAERMQEAVAAFRAALEVQTRNRVPFDWARTQNNLGNVLGALGTREAGTERLQEAVAALRASLEERTRERVPLDWASTQKNLGDTLAALGRRKRGTQHLQEAVDAYRAVLEERTREHVPLDWARTQTSLGNALWALGDRERGTERLREAVEAYQAALEEQTREHVPLEWARTQTSLGNVLRALGDRERGTQYLSRQLQLFGRRWRNKPANASRSTGH
jgi:tetratricopeptide (TPR) repeat protein